MELKEEKEGFFWNYVLIVQFASLVEEDFSRYLSLSMLYGTSLS